MFWQNYALLCSENDMTPNAVCAALGLSSATATHWKNGRIPNGETLSAIADFFGASVDYLLGRAPNIKPDAPQLDPADQELLTLFHDLTLDQQSFIVTTINALVVKNDSEARKKDV